MSRRIPPFKGRTTALAPVSQSTSAAIRGSAQYDVVEEEIIETLSDDDTDFHPRRDAFFGLREMQQHNQSSREEEAEEEYIEEEYVEEEEVVVDVQSLAGITERSEAEVEEYYDEIEYDSKSNLSFDSNTEVEVITDDDDEEFLSPPSAVRGAVRYQSPSTARGLRMSVSLPLASDDDELDETLFEEVLEDDILIIDDDDYVEEEIVGGRDDTEVEEVTLRDDDLLFGQDFTKSCNVKSSNVRSNPESSTDPEVEQREEDEDQEDESDEDEDDGVSAEELTEAIEYVLRQERAVAKFILTEEQAEKMAHLPVKVMKIIVDHLESCDNDGTPIDWDFMLKIVLPFCESANAAEDDDDDASALLCVEITDSPSRRTKAPARS